MRTQEDVEPARAEASVVGSATDRPRVVPGNGGGPSQVFDNLLANIRTHTPPGTAGRVAITDAGDHVVLRIEDDGPGLGGADPARIFDRFWRADATRARTTGSTGLGLSIVHAVVSRHQGTVRADPDRAEGVAITIVLPAAAAPARHQPGAD